MIKLNIKQRNLIIGTLLGNSSLHSETKGRTWFYRTVHQLDNKYYLDYIADQLKDLSIGKPIYEEIYNEKTKKIDKQYYCNSLVNNSLRFYANLFYKSIDGKFIKVIPKNIEKWLNAEVVAHWYMDNGHLKLLGKSKTMILCTEGFSYECVKRLQIAIAKKFEINLSLIKVKKKSIIVGYRLYISETNTIAFRVLIEPYLLDSIKDKVSDNNRNDL